MFARVVQLCKVNNSTWSFLESVKTHGTPLARTTLSKRCRKDNILLSKLSDMTVSAIEIVHLNGSDASHLEIKGLGNIVSFFTATIVDMVTEKALDDGHLRALYYFLINGLKKTAATDGNEAYEQWRKASCLLIAHISASTPLSSSLTQAIVTALAKFISENSPNATSNANAVTLEVVTAIVILSQHQEVVTVFNNAN